MNNLGASNAENGMHFYVKFKVFFQLKLAFLISLIWMSMDKKSSGQGLETNRTLCPHLYIN